MSDHVILRRGLYYRPNAQGYTPHLHEAWRVSKEEARRHEDETAKPPILAFPIEKFLSEYDRMSSATMNFSGGFREVQLSAMLDFALRWSPQKAAVKFQWMVREEKRSGNKVRLIFAEQDLRRELEVLTIPISHSLSAMADEVIYYDGTKKECLKRLAESKTNPVVTNVKDENELIVKTVDWMKEAINSTMKVGGSSLAVVDQLSDEAIITMVRNGIKISS